MQAGLKGPVWFHSHIWCLGWDNSETRASSCTWPFPVAWLPDSTAPHSSQAWARWLRAPRTRVPADKMEVILPLKPSLKVTQHYFHLILLVKTVTNPPIFKGSKIILQFSKEEWQDHTLCREHVGQEILLGHLWTICCSLQVHWWFLFSLKSDSVYSTLFKNAHS